MLPACASLAMAPDLPNWKLESKRHLRHEPGDAAQNWNNYIQQEESRVKDLSHILSLIETGFASARVLVIGDVMLDRYVWGSVDRISPEAPVPVLRSMHTTRVPGGAA